MRRKADAASRIARRWFFVTLALALALMAAGHGRRGQPVERDRRPGAAADRRRRRGWRPASSTRPCRSARPTRSARSPSASTGWPSGFASCAARTSASCSSRSRRPRRRSIRSTTRCIVTDGDGRVTRINPAAERLFGARADTLGKPIDEVTRDPRIAQAVADVLRSQAPGRRRKSAAAVLPWAVDGARRAFRIRSTPMKDADGRLRRRGHAARGHHAPERDQPAEVRVHRRRVARAADAADERADGHPPAARGHRRARWTSASRRFCRCAARTRRGSTG